MNNEEAINFGLEWQCEIQRREDPYSDATQFLELAIEALRNEPKKGIWIDSGDAMEEYKAWGHCSVCGGGMFQSDFCPNCGAEMRETDKEMTTPKTVNLCDDCRFADDCNPTLAGHDEVTTIKCSRYEETESEADNEVD